MYTTVLGTYFSRTCCSTFGVTFWIRYDGLRLVSVYDLPSRVLSSPSFFWLWQSLAFARSVARLILDFLFPVCTAWPHLWLAFLRLRCRTALVRVVVTHGISTCCCHPRLVVYHHNGSYHVSRELSTIINIWAHFLFCNSMHVLLPAYITRHSYVRLACLQWYRLAWLVSIRFRGF